MQPNMRSHMKETLEKAVEDNQSGGAAQSALHRGDLKMAEDG